LATPDHKFLLHAGRGMGYCYLSPVDLPEHNQSTIVSVPLGDREPAPLLRALSDQGIVCAARDGNLRIAVQLYNHEDDIERLVTALAAVNGGHVR
jgi:selenocysteine lyase/cysteine desulfurase